MQQESHFVYKKNVMRELEEEGLVDNNMVLTQIIVDIVYPPHHKQMQLLDKCNCITIYFELNPQAIN